MFGISGGGALLGGGIGLFVGGPAGAAIGAGIGGSLDAQEAADKAASESAKAAKSELAFRKWLYGEQKAESAPWREAAQQGLTDLRALETGAVDLSTIPGYSFQLDQGLDALDAASSARGMALSGRALTEAQTYGMNLAKTTYGDEWNRRAARAGITQVSPSASREAAFQNLAQGYVNPAAAGITQRYQANMAVPSGVQNAVGNLAGQYYMNQFLQPQQQPVRYTTPGVSNMNYGGGTYSTATPWGD